MRNILWRQQDVPRHGLELEFPHPIIVWFALGNVDLILNRNQLRKAWRLSETPLATVARIAQACSARAASRRAVAAGIRRITTQTADHHGRLLRGGKHATFLHAHTKRRFKKLYTTFESTWRTYQPFNMQLSST